MSQTDRFEPTERTRVRRLPKRASYERDEVYRVLDAGLVCHVGFNAGDQPFVIPTVYARIDDRLYIHGSAASRMLRTLSGGIPMCVNVSHIDGVVLARSAFHHSVNYRSAVIVGTAVEVTDAAEAMAALRAIVEHVTPGRWDDVRAPNDKELKATTVLRIPIEEASAKIRTGPPVDDEEDYALPCWAGVVPLSQVAGAPEPDARLAPNVPLPDYLRRR